MHGRGRHHVWCLSPPVAIRDVAQIGRYDVTLSWWRRIYSGIHSNRFTEQTTSRVIEFPSTACTSNIGYLFTPSVVLPPQPRRRQDQSEDQSAAADDDNPKRWESSSARRRRRRTWRDRASVAAARRRFCRRLRSRSRRANRTTPTRRRPRYVGHWRRCRGARAPTTAHRGSNRTFLTSAACPNPSRTGINSPNWIASRSSSSIHHHHLFIYLFVCLFSKTNSVTRKVHHLCSLKIGQCLNFYTRSR